MKVYFDSSALVAAMVTEEIHHEKAAAALGQTHDDFTSTHALAEVFATLTEGRLDLQLSPAEAAEVIEHNVVGRLNVLALTVRDYRKAISECQAAGARGGGMFDMIHLEAARRGKAQRILTTNVRHFQVFAPDLSEIIQLPT